MQNLSLKYKIEIDLEAGVYDDSSYKPGTC